MVLMWWFVGSVRGVNKTDAINMNYGLRVSYGDGTIDVRMDDWMYLITPDTLINQTTMTKWGIEVGEIVLVISKR